MSGERYIRKINGEPVKPIPYYNDQVAFTGEFDLIDEREWPSLVQSGALSFSVSANAAVGGCDRIKITADGNTITVPGGWKNMGTDEISTVAANVNRIMVTKTPDEIQYVVKVN